MAKKQKAPSNQLPTPPVQMQPVEPIIQGQLALALSPNPKLMEQPEEVVTRPVFLSGNRILTKRKYGPFNYLSEVAKVPNLREPMASPQEGKTIPLSLWHSILAFMQWGFDTHRSEVMVVLFYDKEKNEWSAWAPPQELKGLSVDCVQDEEYAKQRKVFGNAVVMGSVHHHCELSAFESGKDANDEKNRPGVHFTVGFMNKAERGFHCRVVVRKESMETEWSQFIENPADAKELPPALFSQVVLHRKSREYAGTLFPEYWKTNCRKRTQSMPTVSMGRDLFDGDQTQHMAERMGVTFFNAIPTFGAGIHEAAHVTTMVPTSITNEWHPSLIAHLDAHPGGTYITIDTETTIESVMAAHPALGPFLSGMYEKATDSVKTLPLNALLGTGIRQAVLGSSAANKDSLVATLAINILEDTCKKWLRDNRRAIINAIEKKETTEFHPFGINTRSWKLNDSLQHVLRCDNTLHLLWLNLYNTFRNYLLCEMEAVNGR